MAILVLLGMAGCTSQIADLAEPADAPPRPAVDPAYPAVHDMPAARDTRPLTAAERQRLTDELSAARERQEVDTVEPAQPRKTTAR
jgi:hypothetical protein